MAALCAKPVGFETLDGLRDAFGNVVCKRPSFLHQDSAERFRTEDGNQESQIRAIHTDKVIHQGATISFNAVQSLVAFRPR
jgi:hypothetical protein